MLSGYRLMVVACLWLTFLKPSFMVFCSLTTKWNEWYIFSVDMLSSVMSLYPHKGNKSANVFAVYLKEITQKRNNYKQTLKEHGRLHFLKKIPHVACSQVEVKPAIVKRAQKATLAFSLCRQNCPIKWWSFEDTIRLYSVNSAQV